MLPPLLPCFSLDYLGWQLLDQPFLFYVFFSFHPSLPRFPHDVYNSCAGSCASSPLFHPPRSYPRSRSRSHLRYCSRFPYLFLATMSFTRLVFFLSVPFCLLSLLFFSPTVFLVLVWFINTVVYCSLVGFRLSCDHGWIRSGSTNAR